MSANPTFGVDRPISVEAYLLDFDGDVYGCPMRLEFHRFLRAPLRFDSIDALMERMWQDVEETRGIMGAAPDA